MTGPKQVAPSCSAGDFGNDAIAAIPLSSAKQFCSTPGNTPSLEFCPHGSFSYPDAQYPNAEIQFWTPLYHERSRANMQMFDAHNFDVIGRLKPHVTIAQANAELNTIQQSIRKQHPLGPIRDATSLRPILDAETYKVKGRSLYPPRRHWLPAVHRVVSTSQICL